jgi:urease alpha subunit
MMAAVNSHATDAGMFGATTGDRVRLGDAHPIIEVERDLTP